MQRPKLPSLTFVQTVSFENEKYRVSFVFESTSRSSCRQASRYLFFVEKKKAHLQQARFLFMRQNTFERGKGYFGCWVFRKLCYFGPIKNQRIRPITGKRIISTIQRTLDPVVAPLWKIFTIAQIFATKRISPRMPPYSKPNILMPFFKALLSFVGRVSFIFRK